MGIQQFMASQLRQPKGWFGSLVLSRVMNRVNRRIIDSTLALLKLDAQHRVLEIGFGGGVALVLLAKLIRSGVVSGVDISADMVRRAERRLRREITEGRVQVQLGDISHLPYEDAVFDRAFTINTIYFWSDALRGLGEMRRVLKDGGLAAVSLRSGEKMQKYAVTKHNFRLFAADEVANLMRQAGFHDVRVDHRDRDKLYDQVVVVGTR
jgi:arsenite methyltransferase